MNFIITVVGLTLLSHYSSQIEFVTLQLGNIQTLFNSAREGKLDNSLNLMKPTENMCSFAIKSKIFKIQNEPNIPHETYFKRDTYAYSVISRLKSKEEKASSKYKQPKDIEEVLQLVEDSSVLNNNSVNLGFQDALNATTCSLYNKIRFYISDGFQKDNITFQFLLGKDVTRVRYSKPLAIIGKPSLTIVEKEFHFDKQSSILKTDENKKKTYKIFDDWVNSITELQCIWIGVNIANYESKRSRKNFNLKFSNIKNSLIFYALKQYEPYIPEGTPLIRFTVEDIDNNETIKSIVVVPDYFGDKSTYFYGFENDKGQFTPKRYVRIPFQ